MLLRHNSRAAAAPKNICKVKQENTFTKCCECKSNKTSKSMVTPVVSSSLVHLSALVTEYVYLLIRFLNGLLFVVRFIWLNNIYGTFRG